MLSLSSNFLWTFQFWKAVELGLYMDLGESQAITGIKVNKMYLVKTFWLLKNKVLYEHEVLRGANLHVNVESCMNWRDSKTKEEGNYPLFKNVITCFFK